MAENPIELAVLGSCPTRDNFNSRFNPNYSRFYRCPLTQNQTSIISLMSGPVELEGDLPDGMSDYDKWNVRTELNKEFLDLLAELRPRYLILDFFADIHFGCVRLDDGRYLTDNRWKLRRTDFYQGLQEAGRFTRLRIQDDPDAYFEVWKEAFDRFVKYLDSSAPDTQVIVHRGYNTNEVLVPGRARPMRLQKFKKLSTLNVPEANRLWSMLDEYAVEATGAEVIDLTERGHTSFAEHPWGPFYVHYTMDYYHQFLAELHKIHLRRTADPELVAMVDDIEAAALERLEIERRARRRVIKQQRRRIEEQAAEIERLRSSGMVAAARRTGGRALRSWRHRTRDGAGDRKNPA